MIPLTSATYTAWRVTERLLARLVFPPPPEGVTDQPATWFGNPAVPPPEIGAALERLVVVGVVRAPDQEWGPIGNQAREERFQVPVHVETAVPGRTSVEARERLEELTSALENGVRGINAGRRLGEQPDECRQFARWGLAIAGVEPMTPPGDGGAIGVAVVLIDFEFRVGTPPVTG